jgi:hypothetical protein
MATAEGPPLAPGQMPPPQPYAPPQPPPYAPQPPPYAPQPQPYAPPQQPVYVPVAVKTNGLAIAAMVLGILWLYWVGSVLAVIFGHIALNQINAAGGTQQGRGMAIAGVVLGWIGIGILLIVIIAAAASPESSY